jgi:DNA-binding sugar fermentation-stimulating protein
MDVKEFVYGTFIEEVKNRFLCKVQVQGEIAECYIPSSCRLENFIRLTGSTVLLKENKTKGCRTKYSVYAVKSGRTFVLLNLSQSNRTIEEQIHKPMFSFLGKRNNVVREKSIAGYKCDLFVEDTETIIEVKSIISNSRTALFPTVHSERATKQLDKICQLLDSGYHVCYVFASLIPGVTEIRINNKDEPYSNHFKQCINKGMTCLGLTIKLSKNTTTVGKLIPISY